MARLIVNNYESLKINENEETLVFVVDVNNGFIKKGALADIDIKEIVPKIIKLIKKYKRVFITDYHKEDAIEFNVFPEHCKEGTEECEIVDELKAVMTDDDIVYKKNSTNFFHVLSKEGKIPTNYKNVIIVGCCTDICVMQFALSLKTYYNQNDMDINVIVPVDCVDTYNAPNYHEAEDYNDFALRIMEQAGINVVSTIE